MSNYFLIVDNRDRSKYIAKQNNVSAFLKILMNGTCKTEISLLIYCQKMSIFNENLRSSYQIVDV